MPKKDYQELTAKSVTEEGAEKMDKTTLVNTLSLEDLWMSNQHPLRGHLSVMQEATQRSNKLKKKESNNFSKHGERGESRKRELSFSPLLQSSPSL